MFLLGAFPFLAPLPFPCRAGAAGAPVPVLGFFELSAAYCVERGVFFAGLVARCATGLGVFGAGASCGATVGR